MTPIDINQIINQVAIFVPITIALVKMATMSGLPKKHAFLLDIVFGILLVWLVPGNMAIKEIIFSGLIVGTSASGLYAGIKKAVTS